MLMTPSWLGAKDYGVKGETFAISEVSLLEVIMGKLNKMAKNGEIEKHQQSIVKQVAKRINRPVPVAGITKAQQNRIFKHDPTLVVPEDIKDHQGRIVAAKGTKVNPLDKVSFGAAMLFLDGDDPAQVAWAKEQDNKGERTIKWVLVKGAPIQLGRAEQRQVYFDQGGMLTKKFGIQAVPARLSQRDKFLIIEEIALGDKP